MSLVSQKNHKKSIFLGFRIPLVSFVGPRCEKNHIFCLFNKLSGVLYTIMHQKRWYYLHNCDKTSFICGTPHIHAIVLLEYGELLDFHYILIRDSPPSGGFP